MDNIVGEIALAFAIFNHFIQTQNTARVQKLLRILSSTGMSTSVERFSWRRGAAGISWFVSRGRTAAAEAPGRAVSRAKFGGIESPHPDAIVARR